MIRVDVVVGVGIEVDLTAEVHLLAIGGMKVGITTEATVIEETEVIAGAEVDLVAIVVGEIGGTEIGGTEIAIGTAVAADAVAAEDQGDHLGIVEAEAGVSV